MNCAVIIPTLNPTDELISFVQRLASYGFQEIIVVDDGTTLPYSHIFEQLSSQRVTILHHKKNLGKGAALKTGIQHLKNSGICGFITADSDGQHGADDVYRVACALLAEPDVTFLWKMFLLEAGLEIIFPLSFSGRPRAFPVRIPRPGFGESPCLCPIPHFPFMETAMTMK